ncbi:MAG: exonuclease domain-containing protein [Oscillospiraceae bacterium]|jgi:DNA polymerase III epsilon subunit-like protein
MGFVVMDMEWNQAMSSQASVFNKLPIHLRGEIIQIGAVRLTDDLQPGEEFQVDVKPVYFRRMHYKVEKLTGFDKERLENGIGFKEAFAQFREFCGEGVTLLTWGSDDQAIMEQNIIIHDLDWDWIDRWVNLQTIYNIQTEAGRNQTGLSIAMEHFQIEQTRVAHDALGDAFNTALVCTKLDLLKGLSQYDEASRILATRACSAEHADGEGTSPAAVEHRAFTGYFEKADAFADPELTTPACPVCGERLSCARWINQGDRRYMSLGKCTCDGSFLIRLKFKSAEDGTWTVNRIMYKADSEMEEFYKSKAHPPRRRRSRSKKKKAAEAT